MAARRSWPDPAECTTTDGPPRHGRLAVAAAAAAAANAIAPPSHRPRPLYEKIQFPPASVSAFSCHTHRVSSPCLDKSLALRPIHAFCHLDSPMAGYLQRNQPKYGCTPIIPAGGGAQLHRDRARGRVSFKGETKQMPSTPNMDTNINSFVPVDTVPTMMISHRSISINQGNS